MTERHPITVDLEPSTLQVLAEKAGLGEDRRLARIIYKKMPSIRDKTVLVRILKELGYISYTVNAIGLLTLKKI